MEFFGVFQCVYGVVGVDFACPQVVPYVLDFGERGFVRARLVDEFFKLAEVENGIVEIVVVGSDLIDSGHLFQRSVFGRSARVVTTKPGNGAVDIRQDSALDVVIIRVVDSGFFDVCFIFLELIPHDERGHHRAFGLAVFFGLSLCGGAFFGFFELL